jgi:O-antigen ligase
MTTQSPASFLSAFDSWDLRYRVLVSLVCIMLSGAFPSLITIFGPSVDTMIWMLILALLGSFWMESPLLSLLRPVAPLVIWMLLYICWGIMAAGYPVFEQGYRFAFLFLAMTSAMAVVTSTPQRLRVFCNAAQWTLVINLAVTLLLMNRPEYQQDPFFMRLNVDVDSDRFAGLWGNANVAGLVSLVILVMSRWASRVNAWIGVVCGLLIIYFTASRTAIWILLGLAPIYLIFLATRKARLNALWIILVLVVCGFFTFGTSTSRIGSALASNPTIARVLDVTESHTKEEGGESRLDVLKLWLDKLPTEPWYGYGLYTFNGGGVGDVKVARPEFPIVGPHNLYLGIYLDVGFLGLLTFLWVIIFQLNAVRRTHLKPSARRTLFALCVILLVFSNFNHNMLSDYPGWIGFALMFLLPSSPALASQRFDPDRA